MTTSLTELRRDRKRLEWLMKQEALLRKCRGNYWLFWPFTGAQQDDFPTPRAAIDAQMAKERKEKRGRK